MESAANGRIRVVMDTTQENLETAVGRAMSRISHFYSLHIEPIIAYIFAWFSKCWTPRRPQSWRRNARRLSTDIYFDMYDDRESGLFDRDELERLLGDEENNTGWSDSEDGPETGDHDHNAMDNSGNGSNPPGDSWIYRTWGTVKSNASSWKKHWPSRKNPMLQYKPSTAGLTGVSLRKSDHAIRSEGISYGYNSVSGSGGDLIDHDGMGSTDTKRKSIASSESLRSLGELFSGDDYSDAALLEDAQLMGDNFLNFARTPSINADSESNKSGAMSDHKMVDKPNYKLPTKLESFPGSLGDDGDSKFLMGNDSSIFTKDQSKPSARHILQIQDEHRDRSNSAPPGLQRINSLISNASLLSKKPKSTYESSPNC